MHRPILPPPSVVWTRVFAAAAGTLALAGAATAQTPPFGPYGTTAGDGQAYRMERLRSQAAESEALARQQSLQTRLTLFQLQADRETATPPPTQVLPLRSLDQERAAREAATTRRETTVRGVGQIDRWLYPTPP